MDQTLQRWAAVSNNRDLIEFVAGMFHRLAVHVTGREEHLTVVHDGRDVQIEAGADDAACDFGVTIDAGEADRLADEASRPTLGDGERFRIMRALFTAATAATLRKPRLASPILKKIVGAESLIHVRLISPVSEEPDATHTLLYAARQWLVIPGLHGRAERRYDMTTDQAAAYQRRVHEVLSHDTIGQWIRFGRWYRQWRESVSTRLPNQ